MRVKYQLYFVCFAYGKTLCGQLRIFFYPNLFPQDDKLWSCFANRLDTLKKSSLHKALFVTHITILISSQTYVVCKHFLQSADFLYCGFHLHCGVRNFKLCVAFSSSWWPPTGFTPAEIFVAQSPTTLSRNPARSRVEILMPAKGSNMRYANIIWSNCVS